MILCCKSTTQVIERTALSWATSHFTGNLMTSLVNNSDIYQKKRLKMVESQLRARGISQPQLLKAMKAIPRHQFVDPALMDQAYTDAPLPIDERQTISQPFIVALMTEALELKGREKVLEIGTGSGYQTAVLAALCDRVFSMERLAPLASKARKILDALGCYNVVIRVGDGTYGWKEEAPFEAIIVTAGAPRVPKNLIEQLTIGGRLVIPVGSHQAQNLYRITRLSEDASKAREEDLGGCRFVDLIGEHGW
ncbi:MAG: protein-L-isoaspartate(D-aspartate) O-methyltransferase [Smithellaceae bacterium]|nr:protein-L-isoaspartate(D-aspartate) O-methyltransferase [Smithellaceae bacterium]